MYIYMYMYIECRFPMSIKTVAHTSHQIERELVPMSRLGSEAFAAPKSALRQSLASTGPVPDPWADQRSSSTLGFHNLPHSRSIGIHDREFYFLDPPGGLGWGVAASLHSWDFREET